MIKRLGAVLAAGAIAAAAWVAGTPVAGADPVCDMAPKTSQRITCEQVCDEQPDVQLCESMKSIIYSENGD